MFPESWQRFALAFWAEFFRRLFWNTAYTVLALILLLSLLPVREF